jgi:xanthine dehydrogenase accessory factor
MNSASEFQRLLAGVRELEAENFAQRAALATIVRTHGSTFRRAGASMLVREDRVVCSLSGGCPENDIIARAKKVIASNAAEIARYNDESAGDVLFEAGCGGELDVLIEPLTQAADTRFLDQLAQMHMQRDAGFMATVYSLQPRPQRLIWNGTAAWSDIEDGALADAILATGTSGTPHAFSRRIDGCEVLFESVRPVHALAIIGANAAAVAMAHSSCALGWKTLVIDQREPPPGLPDAAYFIKSAPATVLDKVPLDAHSSALVMTFNIERDCDWLDALARAPLAYLGAIGSRERAARMRAVAARHGAHLHAPAGLDIGSETPEEIALAVSAEILAVLNRREGRSLAGTATPIHP